MNKAMRDRMEKRAQAWANSPITTERLRAAAEEAERRVAELRKARRIPLETWLRPVDR